MEFILYELVFFYQKKDIEDIKNMHKIYLQCFFKNNDNFDEYVEKFLAYLDSELELFKMRENKYARYKYRKNHISMG